MMDLSALLSFMYQGEVSLPQEQLNSFLALAEELQVKGLVDSGKLEELEKVSSNGAQRRMIKTEHEPPEKRFISNDTHPINHTVKTVQRVEPSVVGNISGHESDPYNKYVSAENIVEHDGGNFDDYGNGDIIQDQLSTSAPTFSENISADGRNEWTCNLCGKVFHHPGSTSQHIAVHQGRTTCSECGKVFNRISDMRTHSRNVHQIYEVS